MEIVVALFFLPCLYAIVSVRKKKVS